MERLHGEKKTDSAYREIGRGNLSTHLLGGGQTGRGIVGEGGKKIVRTRRSPKQVIKHKEKREESQRPPADRD